MGGNPATKRDSDWIQLFMRKVANFSATEKVFAGRRIWRNTVIHVYFYGEILPGFGMETGFFPGDARPPFYDGAGPGNLNYLLESPRELNEQLYQPGLPWAGPRSRTCINPSQRPIPYRCARSPGDCGQPLARVDDPS